MARFLFDTNHLSAALSDESGIRERIYQARRAGDRFGTSVPVLCELESGLYHTSRLESNRRILTSLLRQIRVWPLEPVIAPLYAVIFHDLRAKGRAPSQVDMQLAALSRSINATILTSDNDFIALPDLSVENWLN